MHAQTYINFCHIIILLQNLGWQDIENKEQTVFKLISINPHILVYINVATERKA